MSLRYVHTNIITRDWKNLVKFYVETFDCIPVTPERNLSGHWLEEGTNVKDAHIIGMHLRLPGYGDDGPTLEIFQYDTIIETIPSRANRQGFRHIAFRTDDVYAVMEKALMNGALKIGDVVEREIEGLGKLTFIYIADPDGNIIELQQWN